MTYGIRNKATGAWVENCEFGTRAEADAYMRAQFHREWIDRHEVSERSRAMSERDKQLSMSGPIGDHGDAELSRLRSRVAAMEEALSGLVAWHENNTLHRTGCECGGTSDGGKTWCGQQVQLLAKAKQALEGAGDGT